MWFSRPATHGKDRIGANDTKSLLLKLWHPSSFWLCSSLDTPNLQLLGTTTLSCTSRTTRSFMEGC
jgi:hypothetical protein